MHKLKQQTTDDTSMPAHSGLYRRKYTSKLQGRTLMVHVLQVQQRSAPHWQSGYAEQDSLASDEAAAGNSRKQLSTGSKRTYQDMDAVSVHITWPVIWHVLLLLPA